MRTVARWTLIGLGVLFAGVSSLVLLSLPQIGKNERLLAEMKDRVNAVKEFESSHHRLPTDDELSQMSQQLPSHYTPYHYKLNQGPSDWDADYPTNRPASGGWTLSFWRGEWNEFYSSWDDRYTLSKETLWGFCGPLLFTPLISAAFFFGARKLRASPVTKEKPTGTAPAGM